MRFKKGWGNRPQTGKKNSKKIAPKHIWSWTYRPLSCIHHGNKPASVSDTLGGVAVVEVNQRYRAQVFNRGIKECFLGEAKGAI
ncbi:MAG: hypothetical protein OEX17_00905 [Rhodospirillaceae bacterium]|nr:hypothetical protein [Rhodospirillaceae bacterium]